MTSTHMLTPSSLGQFISSTAKLFSHPNEGELRLGGKQRNQIDQRRRPIHEVRDRGNNNFSQLLDEGISRDPAAHFGVEQDGSRKIARNQAIRPHKINRRDHIRLLGSKTQKTEVF
ncbi:hypothetical protein [Arthrobacter methylotrophus]|uniref:hypothetical protein n=1 Tax=Arthrobacter methylotrophus TaxID=121291 RepID=UPI0031E6DF65